MPCNIFVVVVVAAVVLVVYGCFAKQYSFL